MQAQLKNTDAAAQWHIDRARCISGAWPAALTWPPQGQQRYFRVCRCASLSRTLVRSIWVLVAPHRPARLLLPTGSQARGSTSTGLSNTRARGVTVSVLAWVESVAAWTTPAPWRRWWPWHQVDHDIHNSNLKIEQQLLSLCSRARLSSTAVSLSHTLVTSDWLRLSGPGCRWWLWSARGSREQVTVFACNALAQTRVSCHLPGPTAWNLNHEAETKLLYIWVANS